MNKFLFSPNNQYFYILKHILMFDFGIVLVYYETVIN